MAKQSLPSWECGLKSTEICTYRDPINVTPFVGVWIEMNYLKYHMQHIKVTPFVGVWIEIRQNDLIMENGLRHSLRGSVD